MSQSESRRHDRPRLVSVEITARIVGVPQRYLREKIRAGELPCLKIGRRTFCDPDTITRELLGRDASEAVNKPVTVNLCFSCRSVEQISPGMCAGGGWSTVIQMPMAPFPGMTIHLNDSNYNDLIVEEVHYWLYGNRNGMLSAWVEEWEVKTADEVHALERFLERSGWTPCKDSETFKNGQSVTLENIQYERGVEW